MELLSHLTVANPTFLNSRKGIQERLEPAQGPLPYDQEDLHGMHTCKAGGKSQRLQVSMPANFLGAYTRYCSKKVSSAYSFLSKKKDELRWIPGSRDCPLGHPGILNPCENPQCQLCNVLRGTYLPEIFGKGISTMSLPR